MSKTKTALVNISECVCVRNPISVASDELSCTNIHVLALLKVQHTAESTPAELLAILGF